MFSSWLKLLIWQSLCLITWSHSFCAVFCLLQRPQNTKNDLWNIGFTPQLIGHAARDWQHWNSTAMDSLGYTWTLSLTVARPGQHTLRSFEKHAHLGVPSPPYELIRHQEAAGSITFGRHVSNRLQITYSEFWSQELSIGIYMGRIREGGGWSHNRFLVFCGRSPVYFWATSTKV